VIVRSSLAKGILAMGASAVLAIALSAGSADPQLAVRTDPALGEHLVDGDGRTLYLFTNDVDGTSACYDACATNWPPFLAEGDVAVSDGVDAALIGTTARTDGSVQVTYGGWPLYTFAADASPGDAAGQARNDVWYVVAPDGTAIGQASASNEEGDPFATAMAEGAQVYARICAACHGAQGDEALASHVVLIANNSRLENERLVLRRVIHGNGYMPGFGGVLSDREVAAVATYVRNSFGNQYGLVGEEGAAANR
jgi:predicted lipoprotein with Yx(FWY)xxD motif